MSRNVRVAIAAVGGLVLALLAFTGLGAVAPVLAVLWAAAWLWRFWELR